MWIRSQDKDCLMNCTRIIISHGGEQIAGTDSSGSSYFLGNYKNRERCNEILNDMEKAIHIQKYPKKETDADTVFDYYSIYRMPEK